MSSPEDGPVVAPAVAVLVREVDAREVAATLDVEEVAVFAAVVDEVDVVRSLCVLVKLVRIPAAAAVVCAEANVLDVDEVMAASVLAAAVEVVAAFVLVVDVASVLDVDDVDVASAAVVVADVVVDWNVARSPPASEVAATRVLLDELRDAVVEVEAAFDDDEEVARVDAARLVAVWMDAFGLITLTITAVITIPTTTRTNTIMIMNEVPAVSFDLRAFSPRRGS